jgi:endonuclease/exonuclease/phosphatase family metal-dependent hydrolase
MSDLRVLTFNVLQLPLVSFADAGLRRIELARRLVDRLDADVVVLNEAFNLSASGYLVRWLRSRGYAATPQLGSCHGAGGWTSTTGRRHRGSSLVGGGVVVLSRRGLYEQHELVFASYHRGTLDSCANKGCVLIRTGGTLWIAATHLQADQPGTARAETQVVRLAQLGEIRRVVAAKVPAGDPVLLVGDLNVVHGADHVAAGAAVGGRLEPDGRIHEPTFDATTNPLTRRYFPGHRQVLDYVGCIDENSTRPAPRIRTETIRYAAGEEASDHYPVMATVTSG